MINDELKEALMRVKKKILAEPEVFNMHSWAAEPDPDDPSGVLMGSDMFSIRTLMRRIQLEDCGTICCMAGHMAIDICTRLSDNNYHTVGIEDVVLIYYEHLEGGDMLRSLFRVSHWPREINIKYHNADSELEEDRLRVRAKVAADAIDLYIKDPYVFREFESHKLF